MKTIQKISSNIETYLVKLPKKEPNIYIGLFFKNGYFNEDKKRFGINHLIEHYIVEIVESALNTKKKEINLSGETDNKSIDFTVKYDNSNQAIKGLDEFLDTIYNHNFTDQQILETEKKRIFNEISVKYGALAEKFWETVEKERLLTENIYTRPRLNQIKNIKKFKLLDLKKQFGRLFSKQKVFIVVGARNTDDVFVKKLRAILDKYPLPSAKNNGKLPDAKYSKFKIKNIKLNQIAPDHVRVALTFPGFGTEAPATDRFGLGILFLLLTNKSEFNIAKEARKEGIYAVDCVHDIEERAFGIFTIYSDVPTESLQKFLQIVSSKLKALKNSLISDTELKKMIAEEIKDFSNDWNDNATRCYWVAGKLIDSNEIFSINKLSDEIKSLTPRKIQKIARSVFKKSNLNVLLLHSKRPVDTNFEIRF